jgi:uncharacterized protein (TIGR00725 family)
MKLTIGVMGASGGCPGLPYEAVRGAKAKGGLVVGISPGLSVDEHRGKYGSPVDGFDVLIYTGSGLMGREITNIRSCDMVVIAGGRTGALGELAIAYGEGRLIGVLTGTGAITEMIERILEACGKETGACVLHGDDPARLIDRLIHYYRTEHHRKPSCFCGRKEG